MFLNGSFENMGKGLAGGLAWGSVGGLVWGSAGGLVWGSAGGRLRRCFFSRFNSALLACPSFDFCDPEYSLGAGAVPGDGRTNFL